MKKICSLVLAATIAISSIGSGVTAMAATTTATTSKYVVVLDPGHGGNESGAGAVHNGKVYKEEEINWKIANYTMQALSQSSDIEVHLTKTKNQTVSLMKRVTTAKNYGADLLVSQHINDSDSSYSRGACVLVSSGTYRPSLAAKEKKFASYVLQELGKLGISKNGTGLLYRTSENGSTYPNGKIRDYYGIVAQSVEQNIPGVIIEHAFISSPYDAVNFLSTNAKLKKVGEADARAIIRYCKQLPAKKPTPAPTVAPDTFTGWKEKNGYFYYYINSKRQRNQILNLKDGIYYVNQKGQRQYGWHTVNGKKYYFQKDGKAQLGWMEKNGSYYYFDQTTGTMYKDIMMVSADGKLYIFGKNGKRCSRWTEYQGKKYFINKSGYAQTGWLKVSGKWYYFHKKKAYMYKNRTAVTSTGKKYIFNSKGVCTNRK